MATGQTFIADMQRWGTLSKQQLQAVARQSIQQLAIRTQNNTAPPIGPNVVTAFLINSWQPAIGAPPPLPRGDGAAPPMYGGGGIKDTDAELGVLVASLDIGDSFYYVNNAAYAARQNWGFTGVDSLGRSVHQKGKFFVEKTLAQWPSIVDDVVTDLNFRF